MDQHRFDTLARMLHADGSRRALAATLAGALGLLGFVVPDEAVAANSGKCKPTCSECRTCQKGACRKTPHGKVCKKGTCKAKTTGTACTGGSCCGGVCTNTDGNINHCGACGVVCPATNCADSPGTPYTSCHLFGFETLEWTCGCSSDPPL